MRNFFLFFLISISVFAQSDWNRWEKIEVDYRLEKIDKHENNYTMDVLGAFHYVYKNIISDLDGDNCPFEPSCSNFFMQAYKKTNLLKSSLMFADRFMRDTNVFNRENYKPNRKGKLIDPIDEYK